jgi:hypothetical protein
MEGRYEDVVKALQGTQPFELAVALDDTAFGSTSFVSATGLPGTMLAGTKRERENNISSSSTKCFHSKGLTESGEEMY